MNDPYRSSGAPPERPRDRCVACGGHGYFVLARGVIIECRYCLARKKVAEIAP